MNEKQISTKMIQYMKEHLSENLTLDDLALHAGYSKFHFLRKFHEETGMTVHKYIQNSRLERALQQLKQTDKSIVDIALEAQYQSQVAFTLAFKQRYQCTPYEYRINQNRVCRRKINPVKNTGNMIQMYNNCRRMAA